MTLLEKLSIEIYENFAKTCDDFSKSIDCSRFISDSEYREQVKEALVWISAEYVKYREHFGNLVIKQTNCNDRA